MSEEEVCEFEKLVKENYPEEIIECRDKYFPKGSKKRGEALVLQAVAYVYGKETGKQETIKQVLELIDELLEAYDFGIYINRKIEKLKSQIQNLNKENK